MKQMIGRSMKWVAGVGAALSMVMSAPAVSQEIVWSAHLGLTGGSAYAAKFQLDGFSDFVAWKNAHGGIRGRKIKLLSEDTTWTVPVAIAGYKRLMAEHPEVVFVSGDSTGFVQGTTAENNERFKKLMTAGSFASEFADTKKYPFYFLGGPSYGDQVGVLLKFIKDDWKGAGAPKLAIVHSSVEFGRDPIEGSVKRAKELGIDVALVEQTKFAEVDVGPIALKLRQANPDYTVFHGYAYATWPEVVKLARDYGMKTKFMATIWSSDAPALQKLGPSVNGMIVVAPYPYITTGAKEPMLKVIDEMNRKRDPKYDGYPTHGYMQSWVHAMLSTKAAEMVIDAKKPLTGPNMAAALETVRNWDTGGVFGIPVDIKDHKMAVGRVWQVEMKQGQPIKMVPISNWIKL